MTMDFTKVSLTGFNVASTSSIEDLEAFIVAVDAEVASADCSNCRRKKLRPQKTRAQQRIIRLRRHEVLAAKQAE
jgi:hypothetical protein